MKDKRAMQVQNELNPDADALRPLRNCLTRWISHWGPMNRTWQIYCALLLHAWRLASQPAADANTLAHFSHLRDAHELLCLAAMLPMVAAMQATIKIFQRRDLYVLDLADALSTCEKKVQRLYLDDKAFGRNSFQQLHALEAVLSDDKKKRKASPLVFRRAEGEDKKTLHFRIKLADGSFEHIQLVARPPPTGQAGRPCTLPRPVKRTGFEHLVAAVKVCDLVKFCCFHAVYNWTLHLMLVGILMHVLCEITSISASLREHVSHLQVLAAEAAQQLLADIKERFPDNQLMRAFRILDPNFYLNGGKMEEFMESLETLIAQYGTDKEVEGEKVAAMVDAEDLRSKAGLFFDFAADTASCKFGNGVHNAVAGEDDAGGMEEDAGGSDDDAPQPADDGLDHGEAEEKEEEESDDSGDEGAHPGAPGAGRSRRRRRRRKRHGTPWLVLFWRALMLVSELAEVYVGQYAKLAQILMTLLGTSVEDERLFSLLAFVQNKQRNRLDAHLEPCMRMKAQTLFDDETFPYLDVSKEWHGMRDRRTSVQQRRKE